VKKKWIYGIIFTLALVGLVWAEGEITSWPSLEVGDLSDSDVLVMTDVDDTTEAATGSTKKVTVAEIVTYVFNNIIGTDEQAVTGTSDSVVVTPGNLTARLAAPGAIGGTTPATSIKADELDLTAMADPAWGFNDSDSGDTDKTIARLKANAGTTTEGSVDADWWIDVLQGGSWTEVLRFDESDDQWESTKVMDFAILDPNSDITATMIQAALAEFAAAIELNTAKYTPTAGTYIDVVAGEVTFDPTELMDVVWGDSADSSHVWAWNTGSGTDPTMTVTDSGFTFNKGITISKTEGVPTTITLYEANSTDTNGVKYQGPASRDDDLILKEPDTDPAANQFKLFPAPTAGVSTYAWTTYGDFTGFTVTLPAETIDSDHYVDGSIDNAHLADDAVDSGEIAAGAIDTEHLSSNLDLLTNGTITGRTKIVTLTIASGVHDGDAEAAALTDSGESFTTSQFVGMTIYNITDGSSGLVTANTGTVITATLAGGTDNDWDVDDVWQVGPGPEQSGALFLVTAASTIRHPATAGFTVMYMSNGTAALTVDMASDSMVFKGTLDSSVVTLTAGNAIDSSGSTGDDFIGIVNASATVAKGMGKRGTWTDGGAS
jgi:hypothetical protein